MLELYQNFQKKELHKSFVFIVSYQNSGIWVFEKPLPSDHIFTKHYNRFKHQQHRLKFSNGPTEKE